MNYDDDELDMLADDLAESIFEEMVIVGKAKESQRESLLKKIKKNKEILKLIVRINMKEYDFVYESGFYNGRNS